MQRHKTPIALAFVAGLLRPSTGWPQETEGSQRLRVRAATRVEAALEASERGVVLRGSLSDDRGAGLPLAKLTLSGPIRATPCNASGSSAAGPDRAPALATDDQGRFCAWLSLPKERSVLVRFRGLPLYAPSRLRLRVAAQGPPTLGFGLEGSELSLDRERQRVVVTISPPSPTAAALALRLVDARGLSDLGEAPIAVGQGEAVFWLQRQALGSAGPAQLSAALTSASGEPLGSSRLRVKRTARVAFESAEWEPSPEGTRLRVRLASAGGPVGAGQVRATRAEAAGEVAALVRQGQALLELPAEPETEVELSYRASDSWWLAPAPIRVPPPAQSGSAPPGLGWLWWAFCLPVGYLGWRALQRPGPARGPAEQSPNPELPVAPSRQTQGGSPWPNGQGQVVDAHTGAPVSGATVEVVIPTLEGLRVTAVALTDRGGRFRFTAEQLQQKGALIQAEAEHHSRAQAAARASGRLRIRLSSRRRSLLARLSESARGIERPGVLQPTPRDLMRWAQARGDAQTVAWSQRLERATFGPVKPNRKEEESLTASRPKAPRTRVPGATVDGQ